MLGQLLRFLLVGIGNTIVGLGTIYGLKWLLGAGDIPANMGGYLLGLVVSFMLNRRWTFRHKGATGPAVIRFLLVFGIAYLSNLVVMLWLRDHWRLDSYLAHLLSVVPYTAVFFIGSRLFAFRSETEQVQTRASKLHESSR